MTCAEQLAGFVNRASFDDISNAARLQLKIRVLDALGCAIGAMGGDPVALLRDQVEEFDGEGSCTLIGGGRAAADRASFYNGALVRYLDFNDSYLAKGETCHPSDNLAPVLAAVEYSNGTGRELMTALAVCYQVQCRLSDVAPVRAAGFDHTTQGSYAVAAGVSKALALNAGRLPTPSVSAAPPSMPCGSLARASSLIGRGWRTRTPRPLHVCDVSGDARCYWTTGSVRR